MHPLQPDILRALEEVRPTLQKDGGDVEFISVDEQNVVTIRLTGACENCPMSEVTLREGIEKFIKSEIPAVQSVQALA
ncbi:NifU family protein [Desulfogranum japonicum]|uniref:NifU family protein n=1 Tax=Desulfogranum japonicum TaxID=231447 RepID=UPI0004190534|nr:NifU family protein [Desulfogranum japonicum]